MGGSSFGYLVKEGARNIIANRVISFAAIGVLVACLLLIGASVIFSANMNSVAGYVETQNEVVAFVEDNFPDEELPLIESELNMINNVSKVTFVDKEEGLRLFTEEMGYGDDSLFDYYEGDSPVSHAYRIVISDLSIMEGTLDDIAFVQGIESIDASLEVASVVTSLKRIVSIVGSTISIILAGVSMLIVTNTIRLTVFSRRREISIMKYVGATDNFIRLPFISEGILIGLISAIIAYLLLWGGYTLLLDSVVNSDTYLSIMMLDQLVPFEEVKISIATYFLGGGVGIGAVGSVMFLRKYLKV